MLETYYALTLNPKLLGEALGLSTAEVYQVYQDAPHLRTLAACWTLNLYGERCRLYILTRRGIELPAVAAEGPPLVVLDLAGFPSLRFLPVDPRRLPLPGKQISWARFYTEVIGREVSKVAWETAEVGA